MTVVQTIDQMQKLHLIDLNSKRQQVIEVH